MLKVSFIAYWYILIYSHVLDPCLLILEYVKHGKLLTHLRELRGRQSLFDFADPAGNGALLDAEPGVSGGKDKGSSSSVTAKDLTKYAYGVAKGMEFLVSKGVSARPLLYFFCQRHTVSRFSART